MDSLTQSIIEAEAGLHHTAFPSPWSVFSQSITWFKLKRTYDHREQDFFRQCWESA